MTLRGKCLLPVFCPNGEATEDSDGDGGARPKIPPSGAVLEIQVPRLAPTGVVIHDLLAGQVCVVAAWGRRYPEFDTQCREPLRGRGSPLSSACLPRALYEYALG